MRFSKFCAAVLAAAAPALAMPAQSFAESMIDGKLGYKKGLYYQSEDGRFKIKQNFRIQFRGDITSDNKDGSDTETDFMIRRMKIKVGGHAYEKWIKWGFQMAGSVGRGAGSGSWGIEDAWVAFAKSESADLKFGRYKIPYEREALDSSSSLQFVDRSHVKEFVIDEARGDGISVGGILGSIVAYRAGLFQKDDEKFSGGENTLFAGRVQAGLCCGELKYSSGSFTASGDYKISPNFAKVPTFTVGMGGFYHNGEKGEERYKTIGASGLEDSISQVDVNSNGGFTIDFAAKIDRANFEGAFHYGSAKRLIAGTDANLGADGNVGGGDDKPAVAPRADSVSHTAYRLQGGFMFTPEFEIAARWAYADCDSGNDEWQWTTGLNWYMAKHRAKVQLDYTYGNEKDGISEGRDKKENILRGQIQIYL